MIAPKRVSILLVALVAFLLLGPVLRADAANHVPPDRATPLVGKKIYGVVTSRKIVALTIDDIRTSETETMTDELVKDGLKVTLFCITSELATTEAQYAMAAGMEMADHGWTHVALGSMTSQEASEALESSAQRLNDMVGYWPLWYRSPYLQEGPDGVAETNAHGMLYADISWNSHDYAAGMTSATVAASVSAGLRPGGVVDLHETTTTVAALPLIAKVLRDRGYECLTMSELSTAAPPAASVSMLWKAPVHLSAPAPAGRPSAKRGTVLGGAVTPAFPTAARIQVQRRRKNGSYASYRTYKVKIASAGTWRLKSKLKRGSYRIRSSVSTSDMYRAGVSDWRKLWVY